MLVEVRQQWTLCMLGYESHYCGLADMLTHDSAGFQ